MLHHFYCTYPVVQNDCSASLDQGLVDPDDFIGDCDSTDPHLHLLHVQTGGSDLCHELHSSGHNF